MDGVARAVVEGGENSPPPNPAAVYCPWSREAPEANEVGGAGAMPSSAGDAGRAVADDAHHAAASSLPCHEAPANAPEDATAEQAEAEQQQQQHGHDETEPDWDALCLKMAATPAMARRRTELVVKLDR